MKTKILYICDSLSLGGAEKALVDVLRNLDFGKFDAQLVILQNENAFEHLINSLPVVIHPLGMQRTFPRTSNDALKILRLSHILREFNPDIVHSQGQDPDLYAQCIGMLSRDYIIFNTIHSIDIFRQYPMQASRFYRLKMRLENMMIRYADKVIAVSKGIQEYSITYRKVQPGKVICLRNAIPNLPRTMDKEERKNALLGLSGKKIIGFVGRLSFYKNIFTALDAFANLHKRIPNAHFVIVGDGVLRSSLEKYAVQCNVAEDVHFVGTQKNVQPFYEMFDVFVLPSFSEGLPLVMLEAMSLHVPIVASAVGGIPELIQHERSGLLVHPPDQNYLAESIAENTVSPYVDENQSKELADSLSRVLENEEFASRLASSAFETFRRECSMETNIKKLENLYEDALSRHKGGQGRIPQ
ncbi:MAG TPA: glycosyltransferase [Candidatus Kapabacteria bacterium]|nr:glycosyltransferase [Candidatus Kapabacteria bacterium]